MTLFVQPRSPVEITQTETQRVLLVGASPSEVSHLAAMLDTIEDPKFELDHETAIPHAAQTVNACDAILVAYEGPVEEWSAISKRFTGSHRLPIICIDRDGGVSERRSRRAEIIRDGAAAYLRWDELSPQMLEAAIFWALERTQIQRALTEVQERFALAVRGASDGVWEWILETGEMHFSRRWRELLGYGVDDLTGTLDDWFGRVHADDIEVLKHDIAAHLAGEKPFHENEHRIRASDGTYRWVISRGMAQRQGEHVIRMSGSITDTSDYRLREEKLREESRFDPLTGLLQRAPFVDVLSQAIARANADDGYAFTVMMVDVDRFRWLTDSMGHQAADSLLVILSRRILACIRPGDVVSRFGGDKFAVLLDNLDDMRIGTDLADRIRVSTHEPFDIDGQTVYTTVSIGLTTSSRRYNDPDEVINDVAAAANKAKERGQDRHEVFETRMRIDALATLRLEAALHQAVEQGEFELWYQPIVELKSGKIAGLEALTRWRHPRRGLVSPEEFIPVAEQTGLIVPMGRWVIREALQQLGHWQKSSPRLSNLFMNVNLSGRQIADPRLLDEIRSNMAEFNVRPGTLRLELTESVLLENAERVRRTLTALRDEGVRIWVDDFGTGYSSLSYLHRFPVDGLKIDKTFIDPLDDHAQSGAMIRTILGLADNLHLDAVAEGIETSEQVKQLLRLGCRRGQGFLFGAPRGPKETTQRLLLPPGR